METMLLAENSGREGGIEERIKCEIIILWGEWTREFSEIVRQPYGPSEVDGHAFLVRPVGTDAYFSIAKPSCVHVGTE